MTKKITAAELMAKLNADPEFVGKRAREEEDRLEREAEYCLAEAPLVDELRAAGYRVSSAWDLVNTPDSYPTAVPILLAHLPRPYPAAVREGIARALAVREASCGWEVLTRLYRDEHEVRTTDGAVAIAAAANDELIGGYRLAPVVWIAGGVLALAASYLRMAADRHYFTDVTVGAVLGTGIGIAVPLLLHRPVKDERRAAALRLLDGARISTSEIPGGRIVGVGGCF